MSRFLHPVSLEVSPKPGSTTIGPIEVGSYINWAAGKEGTVIWIQCRLCGAMYSCLVLAEVMVEGSLEDWEPQRMELAQDIILHLGMKHPDA